MFVETNSSGTIYMVPNSDDTTIIKTTDKGDNWSTITNRSYTVVALCHDTTNSRLYFVACDNETVNNTAEVGYIDLTDDSITSLGDLDADEHPDYVGPATDAQWKILDIFQIGSDHYILNEWGEDPEIFNYRNVFDIDAGEGGWVKKAGHYEITASDRRCQGVTVGTDYWFSLQISGGIVLWKFDSTTPGYEYAYNNSDYSIPTDLSQGTIAYDNDDILSFISNKDADSEDHIIEYSITGDSITEGPIFNAGIQPYNQNTGTTPNVRQKAYNYTKDSNNDSSIYFISTTYNFFVKIGEIEENSNIAAISDNFLIYDNGAMYEYQDKNSDITEASIIQEICKAPEGDISSLLNFSTNQLIRLYDDNDVLAFEGITYKRKNIGNKRKYTLRSLAYKLLETEVSADYSSTATEIATIVKYILDLSGIDYLYYDATSIPNTSITTKVKFENKTIRQCFNTLADRCDGVWYLEPDGKVNFHLASALNEEAHHWYGTWDFNTDTIGSAPTGWTQMGDVSRDYNVYLEYDNHKYVMRHGKTVTDAGYEYVYRDFTAQTSGTIEMYMSGTTNAHNYCYIQSDTTAAMVFGLNSDGHLYYYDGAVPTDGGVYTKDQMEHLKVVFNCTSDTYDLYLNGVEIDTGIAFYQNVTSLNRLRYQQDGAGISGWVYIDAIGFSWDTDYTAGDNLKGLGNLTKRISAPTIEQIDEQINKVSIWGGIVDGVRISSTAEDEQSQQLHGIIEWVGTTQYPEIIDQTQLDNLAQSILDSDHAFNYPKTIKFTYFKTNFIQVGETIRFTFDQFSEVEDYADYPILWLKYNIKANFTELRLSNGLLQGGGYGTPIKKKIELLERKVSDAIQLIDQNALNFWEYDSSDPAAYDIDEGDLTIDDSWHELDLDGFKTVPSNVIGFWAKIVLTDNAAAKAIQFRATSQSNVYQTATVRSQVVNVAHDVVIPIPLDSSHKFDYMAESGIDAIKIIVLWWIHGRQ